MNNWDTISKIGGVAYVLVMIIALMVVFGIITVQTLRPRVMRIRQRRQDNHIFKAVKEARNDFVEGGQAGRAVRR